MTEITSRLSTALADRYKIERHLGEGGMATVYLAEDLKHKRKVAVKVLRPDLAAALGPERFLREIEIAANLTHPHIVPLYDSGEADGFLYYVLPYIEGESLRERLNREKQLPIEEGLRIACEVAAALSYAHSVGLVHRDIKPENVLLHHGEAVVTDFGIARAVTAAGGERLTETGLALGTPAYMSPEQASGEADLDGRSDIYSLGCVLYELLVGEAPFTGPSAQAIMARHAVEPLPRVRTVRVTVPDYVEAAIDKALAKVPADRFATGTEFAEALTTPAMPAAPTVLPETRSRISPALILGLVLILGVGLGLVGGSTASEAGFSLFGYAGAWVTVMAGVWFLFEKAEETVSQGTKLAVARWLEGLDPASAPRTWPSTFAATFDRIFGERHFSWKCFRRSCVASLTVVIVLTLIWTMLHPAACEAWSRPT